ncbi:MAG: AMP-binding protein [Lentimicrobium sp.]|jgi:O-succinylbenzoic acid--CoA ligase|nr:AMP-binding protein [Lentimicrobium sp.]
MSIPANLILEGKLYQPEELKSYALLLSNDNEPWKKDLGNFILDWLSPENEIIVNTSGSTGTPRPIHHSKQAMVASARATGEFLGLKAGESALLCLSAKTIAGMMMVVRTMVLKMNLMMATPDGHPLSHLAGDTIPDFTAMVPAQVYNSINAVKDMKILSRIPKLIIGGGEINPALEQQMIALPNAIYATYGMTETITHVALRKINGANRSDFFWTLPGIKLETDERGCLVITAPRILTEPIVTNDLVELKTNNQFRWLGRFDNIINRGGQKIIPEEVEQKISGIITSRYFISAAKDDKFGEVPVLIIESKEINDISKRLLLNQLKLALGREAPSKIYTIVRFSETGSGKINRRATCRELEF